MPNAYNVKSVEREGQEEFVMEQSRLAQQPPDLQDKKTWDR